MVERPQVNEGSCTFPGAQLIKVDSEVADRLSLGVILGLTELSPNSLPFLNFSTWSIANFLSEMIGLANRDRIKHSGWAYHAPVFTYGVIASFTFLGWVLRILKLVRTWYGASTMRWRTLML